MTLALTGIDSHASRILTIQDSAPTLSTYAPFGTTAALAPTSLPMPGFNGQRMDAVTDSFPLGNGYRAYAPSLSRFRCPDIDSPFGIGGVNPYVYCEHDPINLADPSGHGFMRRIRKGATRVARFFRGESGDSMSTSLRRTVPERRADHELRELTPERTPELIRIPILFDEEGRPIEHHADLPPALEDIFSLRMRLGEGGVQLRELGYTDHFNGRPAHVLLMHGTRRNTVNFVEGWYADQTPFDNPRRELTPRQLIRYLDRRGLEMRGHGDDDAPLYLVACHIHLQSFPRELAFRLNRPVVTFGQGHRISGSRYLRNWANGSPNIKATTEELYPPKIAPRIPLVLKHLPSDFDSLLLL